MRGCSRLTLSGALEWTCRGRDFGLASLSMSDIKVDNEKSAAMKTAPSAGTSKNLRESGRLTLLTGISRVLGLIREMSRAAFLGTNWLGDAFSVAFTLPNFMRRLFAEGSATAAFVPVFSDYLAEGDKEKTQEFLKAIFTVLLFLVTIVVIIGICTAQWLVLPFKSDHHDEMALLTRIMFPFLGFVSIAAIIQGMLNSMGIFGPSGMAPILFNLCWIFVPYLIGARMGNAARAMAVGVFVGGIAEILCQIPALKKTGYHLGLMQIGPAFRHPGTKRVLSLIAPTIIGMAAYQLNILVSSALATQAGTGAVSAIQYSLRLQELVLGVFVASAGTVLLPDLSRSAKLGNWPSYVHSFGVALKAIFLITIPVAAFSLIEGEDIVVLLFKRRQFGDESVRLTTAVFFCHMLGLAFIAANRIASSAFYARGDTVTPTKAGIVSIAVNIVAAWLLVKPLGAAGIALALSIASAVNTGILVVDLQRKSPPEGLKAEMLGAGRYSLILVLFSAIASGILLGCKKLLPAGGISGMVGSQTVGAGLSLLAAGLLYAAVGIGLLALSRDKFAADLVQSFVRRGKKRA